MPDATGRTTAKATISAKVTRADGTVEDLGVIADVGDADANAVVRLLCKIKGKLRK